MVQATWKRESQPPPHRIHMNWFDMACRTNNENHEPSIKIYSKIALWPWGRKGFLGIFTEKKKHKLLKKRLINWTSNKNNK